LDALHDQNRRISHERFGKPTRFRISRFFPTRGIFGGGVVWFLTPAILGWRRICGSSITPFPDGVAGMWDAWGPTGYAHHDDGFVSNTPLQLIPMFSGSPRRSTAGQSSGLRRDGFLLSDFQHLCVALILWVFITSKRSQWVVHIAWK